MKTNKFKKQYHKYQKTDNSRNKIPPIEKHWNHEVEIRPGYGPHKLQYFCVKCQCHVSWIGKKEQKKLMEIINDKKPTSFIPQMV